jgi:predicted P-loop ATPase
MIFHGTFTIKTPYDLGDGSRPIEAHELESLDKESQTRIKLADPKTFELVTMLANLRYASRKLKLNYKDFEIEHALKYWVNRTRNDLIAQSISSLVYAGDVYRDCTENMWDQYISAITDQNKEETKTVIKHFIWQVKRKMFKLPVKYHMMLIFKGQQEGGKSTMVRELNKPVKDFFASTNFKAITEDKSHNIWDNYVLFFDEMGHSTTSNIEDIKRRITEDSFSSRIMRTNIDTIVNNRSTFIGASNKDLSRLIFDDTGMRRFFQVLCKAKLDWVALEGIDWTRLWRSVNEEAETPLLADTELLSNIKQMQASKRQISMMEKWLRERPHKQFVEETIMAQAFYEEFVEFEKKNSGGQRSDTNNTKFARDVKDIALLVSGLTLIKSPRSNKGNAYKITYTEPTDLAGDEE